MWLMQNKTQNYWTCKPTFSGPHLLVRRGLYVYQIEWWLAHFPKEQLLVLNHEEASDC